MTFAPPCEAGAQPKRWECTGAAEKEQFRGQAPRFGAWPRVVVSRQAWAMLPRESGSTSAVAARRITVRTLSARAGDQASTSGVV